MPNPTPEQLAIQAHARDTDASLVVDAKAGSGKSHTLVELVLPVLRGSTSLQAFNKSIATELQTKANAKLDFAQKLITSISTVHSHGLSSFRKQGLKPQTLTGKVSFIVKDLLQASAVRDDDDIHRNTRHIKSLVGFAKAAGFGLQSAGEVFPTIEDPENWHLLLEHFGLDLELEGKTSPEEIVEWAQRVLKLNNARTTAVDFDDMIYLPLLHNFNIPTYANVLLDEAQDINATRRELAFRSIAPGGRIIAVGDPHQAIYGFTGADVQSLQRIKDRAGAQTLTLSICWRCDEAVIREAQKIVSGIQPAQHKLGKGSVRQVMFEAPPTNAETYHPDDPRGWGKDLQDRDFLDMPQPGDAILCRLNKPNVAVALGLIRRGQPARIEGRDLGKRLLEHVKKATSFYALQPLDVTLLDLETYRDIQVELLFQKKREYAAELLADEVDAAALLINRVCEQNMPYRQASGASFEDLERMVEDLFGDNLPSANVITLSSVHKAKGREWPRVFILGWRDYMPFHLAKAPWEKVQEENLKYVAVTRAERELVLVNGVQSALDKGVHRAAPKVRLNGKLLEPCPEEAGLADLTEVEKRLDASDLGL